MPFCHNCPYGGPGEWCWKDCKLPEASNHGKCFVSLNAMPNPDGVLHQQASPDYRELLKPRKLEISGMADCDIDLLVGGIMSFSAADLSDLAPLRGDPGAVADALGFKAAKGWEVLADFLCRLMRVRANAEHAQMLLRGYTQAETARLRGVSRQRQFQIERRLLAAFPECQGVGAESKWKGKRHSPVIE
jgi:hypothetical protein